MLDLIYPPVCGICNKINPKYICENCEEKIEKYYINQIIDYRKNKKMYYDYQIKILKYENIIRDKIIDYKFKEKTYLHKTFEKMIINNQKIYSFLKKYDIMIPVPIYITKRWARGYNQTELIAKGLSKKLNIKLKSNVLKKIRNTKKQSSLTKTERKQNIKDAFIVINENDIADKKIILFDDIITKGSTLNECSKILRKANVKEVAILTIAVD